MRGFLVKVISCPILILLADAFFPNVYYPSIFQAIFVGLILAVVGQVMEVMILRRGTFWISTIMDFLAAAVLVYIVSLLLPGARVTFVGSLLTALLFEAAEYLVHRWILGTGLNKRSGQRI